MELDPIVHSHIAFVAILALALSGALSALQSTERLIGLLPLPQNFDRDSCGKEGSEEVVLRPTAASPETIGSIRVDCRYQIANQFATNGTLVAEVLLSHSFCESLREPFVVRRGWMPGHDPTGEPTVWFASRGC